jgi:hypothetical protein
MPLLKINKALHTFKVLALWFDAHVMIADKRQIMRDPSPLQEALHVHHPS